MSKASDARIVWNHSTHLPGLIPILEKLIEQPGIGTVTPGVIANVRAHAPHLAHQSICAHSGWFLS